MSLDALAPDQRAVVQLVLQQDRSYEELAGLLGISPDAVRERALRGLERVAPGDALSDGERGDIADYLLGQQSVSQRSATRALLARSQPARTWARRLAEELGDVARGPLPEVPDDEAAQDDLPDTPVADTAPGGTGVPAPGGEPPEPVEAPARPVRARPRPRRERPGAPAGRGEPRTAATAVTAGTAADPGAPAGGDDEQRPAGGLWQSGRDEGAGPRSNRLGGALLIGGLALVLVAVVLLLVSGGDDDDGGTTAEATPTPTATASPEFQPLGRIVLRAPGGGDAEGEMVIFASQDGGVAFTIQGENVPRSREGEAYAVWLTGGDRPRRLGFAPTVGGDGRLGTSGPREADQRNFARWFSEADGVVVSRETSEDAGEPGPVILRGDVPQEDQGAGSGDEGG